MSMKRKSGLHKEISSIFSGVPLPDDKANGPLVDMEKKDKTAGHIPPMPTAAVKGPQLNQQEPSKPSPKPEDKAVPAPEKSVPAPEKSVPAPKQSVPAPKQTSTGSANKKVNLSGFRKSVSKFLQPMKAKLLTPPEGVSQAKHMTMLILIPALFLVVVLVFGRTLLKSGAKNKGAKGDDAGISSVASKSQIEWQRPAVYPVGLRDPMKRGSRQTVAVIVGPGPTTDSGIIVRGIAWSEDKPAVIIGTEIYYQEQVIHDAKIIKINMDSVEFEKDGKQWTQKVSN